MNSSKVFTDYDLLIEQRLVKVESNADSIQSDIKEIKRNLRWLMGIVFSLNSTILGVISKGFNLF